MAEDTSLELGSELAERLRSASTAPLPDAVELEAARSLLNVLATCIGASQQPAVAIVLGVADRLGSPRTAPVPGRRERCDRHHAALATGIAAHLDDFDDTHLETVIHPGAACLASGFPLGVEVGASGPAFLTAFALGIETQLRIGKAMSPAHYDEGWHITGTVGAIGAAVTAGLLLGLDTEQLDVAISIAAAHPLGHRESFGTMEKAFHPGRAAAWGITSAALANAGYPAFRHIFEGPAGYFGVLSALNQPEVVLAAWGGTWEILSNTYKPYPCGIVCHPAIDAAIAIRRRGFDPGTVRGIDIHCNPLVAELTGNPNPGDGLEARFSTIHGVAAGLADGRVGLAQYADDRVISPDLVRLRSFARLLPDPSVRRDAAVLEVKLAGGEVLREEVTHARGSLERPLTDAELREKAEGLIEPVLPGRTGIVMQAVRELAGADGLAGLLEAVTPEGGP